MSNRGKNPNSHDALRKAAAAKKKDAKQIHITLSPEAIATSTAEAEAQGISRSELFEKYARNPLSYLDWVRSQIQNDFEWIVFWEAVEESICFRHGQTRRKLNALAVFRFLRQEDITNGQKAVCEIRAKESPVEAK